MALTTRADKIRFVQVRHEEAAASDKEAKDVSKFGSDTPMKRRAQPEEIAPGYVFRASPHCSSYITGEILPIIGGYSGG